MDNTSAFGLFELIRAKAINERTFALYAYLSLTQGKAMSYADISAGTGFHRNTIIVHLKLLTLIGVAQQRGSPGLPCVYKVKSVTNDVVYRATHGKMAGKVAELLDLSNRGWTAYVKQILGETKASKIASSRGSKNTPVSDSGPDNHGAETPLQKSDTERNRPRNTGVPEKQSLGEASGTHTNRRLPIRYTNPSLTPTYPTSPSSQTRRGGGEGPVKNAEPQTGRRAGVTPTGTPPPPSVAFQRDPIWVAAQKVLVKYFPKAIGMVEKYAVDRRYDAVLSLLASKDFDLEQYCKWWASKKQPVYNFSPGLFFYGDMIQEFLGDDAYRNQQKRKDVKSYWADPKRKALAEKTRKELSRYVRGGGKQ